jgi:geranylgeranyl pyrophosphate synthase
MSHALATKALQEEPRAVFPKGEALEKLLGLSFYTDLEDLISAALFAPIEDLLARPSKRFRGRLVDIGFLLSDSIGARLPNRDEQALCDTFGEVLELLHAGSLIVDDIEDSSQTRRGAPALHLCYELPVALNAGNWLYFWPMQKIQALGLSAEAELAVYRCYHNVLLRAHFGQALDVGTKIDTLPQERVAGVCYASLTLKSGALMAFALQLGAMAAKASEARLALLAEFGHRFGVALQMFDDLGNFLPGNARRFEDLLLQRPSFLWWVASSVTEKETYSSFVDAARQLPDSSALMAWAEQHSFVALARKQASAFLWQSIELLERELANEAGRKPVLAELRTLGEKLEKAYG